LKQTKKHDKINKNQTKKRDYTMDKFIKQLGTTTKSASAKKTASGKTKKTSTEK